MRMYQSKTLLNTEISLPCASVYCLTAPRVRYNHAKHSISKDKSFLSRHIFLPLYWQSLPSILICIDSKEHSHHYFTQRPSYFDIWREISVFLPYSSWETIVWGRIANFEQVLWGSFFNCPDPLFSRQFTEDTPISQFWSISEVSLILLNPPPTVMFCW